MAEQFDMLDYLKRLEGVKYRVTSDKIIWNYELYREQSLPNPPIFDLTDFSDEYVWFNAGGSGGAGLIINCGFGNIKCVKGGFTWVSCNGTKRVVIPPNQYYPELVIMSIVLQSGSEVWVSRYGWYGDEYEVGGKPAKPSGYLDVTDMELFQQGEGVGIDVYYQGKLGGGSDVLIVEVDGRVVREVNVSAGDETKVWEGYVETGYGVHKVCAYMMNYSHKVCKKIDVKKTTTKVSPTNPPSGKSGNKSGRKSGSGEFNWSSIEVPVAVLLGVGAAVLLSRRR